MRDWIHSLWPASFGGQPFYIEKDEAEFGKKVVVHEFPQRDRPFVEALGQSARRFEVNAYVASDAADADADGLVAAFTQPGFQMLVLPDQGPQLCMFVKGKRTRERDKMGFVAFTLSFVAQGAAAPVVSVPFLAQTAFDAAASLAGAASSLMANLAL